ncbi:hypothetical protein S14_101 [Shewanella sp. phage 1/4]|nr:hypothetical protein S14_101 [Shewanella sp. phage 1/4]AHK11210.1 hypothetical protein S14_101 [Shewanella sp. phage 1/4]
MITVFANNKQVPVRMVEFSDGAITFKLDELPKNRGSCHEFKV